MPKKPTVTDSVAIHSDTPPVPGFDQLPFAALLRQAQLIRSAKNPTAPLPFSAATLWRKVKDGTFPAPVKLSERITAWQAGAVREWLASARKAGV